MKKLIYILNQYSKKDSSHFFHILNLLEEIANLDVLITLVIEKSDGIPLFKNPNIKVIVQLEKSKLRRAVELFFILKTLNNNGYKKIFIRISQFSTLISIVVAKLFKGEVYYWQSGTTHILDKKNSISFELIKKHTDFFVTGPESMLDYYHSIVGVDKNKLLLLYNDIDLTRFNFQHQNTQRIKRELKIIQNKKIILFVHRLSPVRKNLFYMPFIFNEFYKNNKNKDCVFYILGGGPDLDELRRLVINHNLHEQVFILGNKPNFEIEKYYQISDMFINPTFTEGFPRVVLEAMACGLPIVTTNAGGVCNLLGDLQKEFVVDVHDRHESLHLN